MINFSELLWKPERVTRKALFTSSDGDSDVIENTLSGIPIQEVRLDASSRVVFKADPHGPGADRFRFLRMRLRELKDLTKLRSVVITSPLPKDGKSTVALNLASALAEEGKRKVLLIEADLYHPSLGARLGVASEFGLAGCLEDSVDPMSVMRRLEPLGWYLLPAGIPRGNPTELLQSESFSNLFQKLSTLFDWVLIDTPPIRSLTDGVILSRQADATLLVVRANFTPIDAVEDAVELIGRKHILGIVFNGAESLNRLYSKYYGHYRKQ